MKKFFILTFFVILTLSSSAFAKIKFKELDEDTIVSINDHNISVDEIKRLREERSQHSAGMHRRKGSVVPDSMYLKGIIDNYIIIEYGIENNFKDTYDYKSLIKNFKETYILNNYVNAEIYSKIEEDNPKKRNMLAEEMIEKKPEEYKSNYKIEVDKELIKKEELTNNYNKIKVVARVDDYEITLGDVINKTTSLYLEKNNPSMLSQESLENALNSLVRRAIILQEAIKLGYGEDMPEPTEKDENDFLSTIFSLQESDKVVNSDEDLLEMFKMNELYYLKKYMMVKYGIIVKKNKKELEEIKNRIDNGEDFFEIAKKESEDTYSKDNGGIQDYTAGASELIKKACFRLEDGKVSDIIKEGRHYYIIKKLGLKKNTFEELKPYVDNDLREEKVKMLIAEKVRELREKAAITVNSNLISEKDFFKVEDIVPGPEEKE